MCLHAFEKILLEGVASVGVHFTVGRHDGDGFIIKFCGESNGEKGDYNDLVKIKEKETLGQGCVNCWWKSVDMTYEFHFFHFGVFRTSVDC